MSKGSFCVCVGGAPSTRITKLYYTYLRATDSSKKKIKIFMSFHGVDEKFFHRKKIRTKCFEDFSLLIRTFASHQMVLREKEENKNRYEQFLFFSPALRCNLSLKGKEKLPLFPSKVTDFSFFVAIIKLRASFEWQKFFPFSLASLFSLSLNQLESMAVAGKCI